MGVLYASIVFKNKSIRVKRRASDTLQIKFYRKQLACKAHIDSWQSLVFIWREQWRAPARTNEICHLLHTDHSTNIPRTSTLQPPSVHKAAISSQWTISIPATNNWQQGKLPSYLSPPPHWHISTTPPSLPTLTLSLPEAHMSLQSPSLHLCKESKCFKIKYNHLPALANEFFSFITLSLWTQFLLSSDLCLSF